MASFASYPPLYNHSTTRIPPSRALALISNYLTASNTDPSLHPNALLTESGPVAPSSGSTTGLILHNLRRVQAGLQGEHLGADLTFQKFGGEELPELQVGPGPGNQVDWDGRNQGGEEAREEEGWQDRGEFERQQVVIGRGGEGEERAGAEVKGGEVEVEVPRVQATKSIGDKDVRKQKKKEKRLQERREKEMKNKRERAAEY